MIAEMDEITIQRLESTGLSVLGILTLIDLEHIDGDKLKNLMDLHSDDFDTSFESDANKKVQFQTLLNSYSSEITLKDIKSIFKRVAD